MWILVPSIDYNWINRCFNFTVVIATWAEFGTLDCRMLHFSSCNSYLNRNLQLSPLWIWISNIQRISNVQYQTTVWYSVHNFNLKIQRPISINCWIFGWILCGMWILGPSIDYNYNLVLIGFEYPISNEYPTSNIKRPFDIRFTTSFWKSNI